MFYVLPFKFYVLPFTFYLLRFTFYHLPFTFFDVHGSWLMAGKSLVTIAIPWVEIWGNISAAVGGAAALGAAAHVNNIGYP